MGLVDVCAILFENSERATGKPVAVAEEREGWTGDTLTRPMAEPDAENWLKIRNPLVADWITDRF